MDLFIYCGESSGDLLGADLLHDLKQQRPNLKAEGVGGPRLREEGLKCFLQMEQFNVMGFFDVIPALPRIARYFFKIRKRILEQNPKCVVLIDYVEFNMLLAKSLR